MFIVVFVYTVCFACPKYAWLVTVLVTLYNVYVQVQIVSFLVTCVLWTLCTFAL